MTRTTKNKKDSLVLRKTIFCLLLSFLFISLSSYFYLVISMTYNVVERRSLENKISVLNGQVNELDLIYLNMIKGLDKEYALSNGFTDNKQNLYVSKDVNHMAIR